jgi:hypothetical protein
MTTIPSIETTNHIEEVRALLADIRSVRERIVAFTHDRKEVRARLTFNAGVSDAFFEAVAMAIEASEALLAAAQTTPAKLRDVISYSQAYASLADEFELIARGVRFSIAERRAGEAQMALQAYAIAKRLNRPSDRALLVPHIDAMRRALNRGRRPQARPEEPAVPPTTPVPPAPIGGAA